MYADIIFLNGEVLTINSEDSVEQAVAVKGKTIMDVGTSMRIKALAGPDTKIIDLSGRSLVPGFIDSHLHMGLLGMNMMSIDCRFPHVKSIEDIKELIKDKAKNLPKGTWIRGWGYDHSKLAENRHPDRYDLDEAAPDHPVTVARACAHISAHNSMSLDIAGITANTPDPEGGIIGRDDGIPNGVMFENAHMDMAKVSLPSAEELRLAFLKANEFLISQGITQIHDSGGFGYLQTNVLQDMINNGEIGLKIYAMFFSLINNLDYINDYIKKGYGAEKDVEKFRFGPIKLMIDGSSSGPTAATILPYTSNQDDSGLMTMTQNEIDDYVVRAHKAGYQVTCHAVGDRAVTAIVDAIEKALAAYPRENHRHRIEHCAMTNQELIARIKKLGIVPVAQPIFLYEFGDGYMRNYGEERVNNMFACRDFFDNGIVCAGSSDCPITFSDPIWGIHSAVNRITQSGRAISQNQRVSVMEALRMYTSNGSYAAFEEDRKGSIEIGKAADFTLLSHSLLKHNPENIKDIRVDMTVIDGEMVYQRL